MQSDRDLLKQALHTLDGWANHGNWVWPDSALEQAKRNTTEAITALRKRLAQPEFDSALQSAAMTQTAPKLAQPEQWEQFYPDIGNPLDRMAENARELGLDYEPVQEPVAWRGPEQYSPDVGSWFEYYDEFRQVSITNGLTPLYTTPPRCPNCESLEAQNTELDKKLAETEQEPVAWCVYCDGQFNLNIFQVKDVADVEKARLDLKYPGHKREVVPLYTTPQPNNIANSEAIPEQISEPVVVHQFRKQWCADWYDGYPDHEDGGGPYQVRTLYTTPTRREWVGLTDEDCVDAIDEYFDFALDNGNVSNASVIRYARVIEAKLKEKNA